MPRVTPMQAGSFAFWGRLLTKYFFVSFSAYVFIAIIASNAALEAAFAGKPHAAFPTDNLKPQIRLHLRKLLKNRFWRRPGGQKCEINLRHTPVSWPHVHPEAKIGRIPLRSPFIERPVIPIRGSILLDVRLPSVRLPLVFRIKFLKEL